MNVTLDRHCLFHLADRTAAGLALERVVARTDLRCFVVDIACAEMRRRGVTPEHYERFEGLLSAARLRHLPRLEPMFLVDVTFWGRCVPASAETARLAQEVGAALFGEAPALEMPPAGLDSPSGRAWIDRHCDVQALWCHIRNRNDIFVTTDEGLVLASRRSRLAELGAGRICLPDELWGPRRR